MKTSAVLLPHEDAVRMLVERILPAYLLELTISHMRASEPSYEVREDVTKLLQRAQAATLSGTTDLDRRAMLFRLEDLTQKMIEAASRGWVGADWRRAAGAAVMFVLSLVDRRLYEDATNQAVLLSLVLQEEMDEEQDIFGKVSDRSNAGEVMFKEAQSQGYFGAKPLLLQ